MESFNLFDGELDDERTEPAGFTWRARDGRARSSAPRSSVRASTSCSRARSSFPYHYEYGAEEWLLVVAGRPTLRAPDGEHELRRGGRGRLPGRA